MTSLQMHNLCGHCHALHPAPLSYACHAGVAVAHVASALDVLQDRGVVLDLHVPLVDLVVIVRLDCHFGLVDLVASPELVVSKDES